MRLASKVCFFVSCLAGCALATEAGDRSVVDATDLDFTLLGMSGPHVRGETLDVALVELQEEDQQGLLGRARVVLTDPPASRLSLERVLLAHVVPDGRKVRALFYVDSDNDYVFDDPEHVWQEDVPASGELTFRHANRFQKFDQDKPREIGGDMVFELPSAANAAFGAACFEGRVKDTLEISVFFDPAGQKKQVGYFKTYRVNGLPSAPIRLNGITDTNSPHGIQVTVDGVAGAIIDLGAATPAGLTVPFSTWFPIDDAAGVPCTGAP